MLYPQKTYSILQTTLLTLFLYVPLAVRCLATVVTWNAQPWRDLGNKLLMELSHVAHAVKTIVAFYQLCLSVMVKSLADILFNELGARLKLGYGATNIVYRIAIMPCLTHSVR